MENASKALLIAGAILISILIIAIGMYIYSSSQGSIDSAMASMDTQEIDAFNKEWQNYDGRKTGTQVKALISKLIANVETYRDEPVKILECACQAEGDEDDDYIVAENYDEDTEADFIAELNDAYSSVKAKHTYRIVLTYATNGLITGITINYDVDNGDQYDNFIINGEE